MANPAIIPGWSGNYSWVGKYSGRRSRRIVPSEKEAERAEGGGEKRVFEKRNGQVKKRRLVVARVGFRGHRASFARSHARGRLGAGGGLPMAPAIFHN